MAEPATKVVACQLPHPQDPQRDVPQLIANAARSVEDGGIAVLPEYFYKPKATLPAPEALEGFSFVQDELVEASAAIQGALVGTVPELTDGGVYNTAVVAEGGRIVHRQRKIRPTPKERDQGITPASGLSLARVQGLELGTLVCADVLALDLLVEMAHLAPDVVAVPVLSPNRGTTEDPTRHARTSLFVARAWDIGAYIVKAGGFAEPEIVGRSLITAPWGTVAQAKDQFSKTLLATQVDQALLDEVRRDFEPLGEA